MYTYLKIVRILQEGIELAKKTRNKKTEDDLKMRKAELIVVINPFLDYVLQEYGDEYSRFIISYFINGNCMAKAECDAESYSSAETMRRQTARCCEYYDRKYKEVSEADRGC